jgi:hypothetical protein
MLVTSDLRGLHTLLDEIPSAVGRPVVSRAIARIHIQGESQGGLHKAAIAFLWNVIDTASTAAAGRDRF